MSGLFKLNAADFIKGLIVAAFGAGLTAIQQVVAASGPNAVYSINWKLICGVAAAAGISYLAKNLGTTDSGVALGIQATAPPPAAKG